MSIAAPDERGYISVVIEGKIDPEDFLRDEGEARDFLKRVQDVNIGFLLKHPERDDPHDEFGGRWTSSMKGGFTIRLAGDRTGEWRP